jgi:prevent-host-death family protein
MEGDMPITTLTSREFNQDSGKAKKAAKNGPVFITERGEPAYVIMTAEDYKKLAPVKPGMSLGEAVAQKDGPFFDYDFPRVQEISKPFEFD